MTFRREVKKKVAKNQEWKVTTRTKVPIWM
jgi:hypothetical protein